MGAFDQVKGAVEQAVDKLNPLGGGNQEEQRAEQEAERSSERQAAPAPAADSEEVRVQRAEEELQIGKTEREAGSVGACKTVGTETVQQQVPLQREEVHVERVPVDADSTATIGAEEVRVPVHEEEAVVSKRPVAKEEVRIHKDTHTDTETVSAGLRKEKLDIEGEPSSS